MRVIIAAALAVVVAGTPRTNPLTSWELQSGAALGPGIGGQQLSMQNFNSSGWYPATVPCTVMACLIENGEYQDMYYGLNLQTVDEGRFNGSSGWWYRTVVGAPPENAAQYLTFHGVNYKADVWVNGHLVRSASDMVGTFRRFDVALASVVPGGQSFAVAVNVFQPHDRVFPPGNSDTDLAISFIDWSPPPPDKNLGLWREVTLTTALTGAPAPAVAVRFPSVSPNVTRSGDAAVAALNVSVEVYNPGSAAVTGSVVVEVEVVRGQAAVKLTQAVASLAAGSSTLLQWSPQDHPGLVVKNPAWWSPDAPALNTLTAQFTSSGGYATELLNTTFGVRDAVSRLDANGNRLFTINGDDVMVFGGGWAPPDLFLRYSRQRLEAELRYVKLMGLNTVRLEGKFPPDYFFDITDELGIYVMVGWSCCDAWQHWPSWTNTTRSIAAESLRSQVQRLRRHPSVFVFLIGSDEAPPADVEAMYDAVFQEEAWPGLVLAAASNRTSTLTGPTGVKMSGPYAYVPPNYWIQGTDPPRLGGAFGFLTEGSPGAAPMTLESMTATMDASDLWPIGDVWDFHCGNPAGLFYNLRFFTPALQARFGNSSSAKEYLAKAQLATYNSHRAMFEGYSIMRFQAATGVVQWMLNNGWTENIWHLYDHYLNMGGSGYGVQKALASPLHVAFDYQNSVYCVNSLSGPSGTFTVTVSGHLMTGERVFASNYTMGAVPTGVSFVGKVAQLQDLKPVGVLRLAIVGGDHPEVNDYVLSSTPDVLDWADSNFYRTPIKSYADFTSLCALPDVAVTAKFLPSTLSSAPAAGGTSFSVDVEVASPADAAAVAVGVRLRVLPVAGPFRGSGVKAPPDVLPVAWTENYVTLLPAEVRRVGVSFVAPGALSDYHVVVETFNDAVKC